MKNWLKVVGLGAGLSLCASAANSATIVDIVDPGQEGWDTISGSDGSLYWEHDVGEFPGLSFYGELEIELRDDQSYDGDEDADIVVGIEFIGDDKFNYDISKNGNFETALAPSSLLLVNLGGVLGVTVSNDPTNLCLFSSCRYGDFEVGLSTLTLKTTAVPVPATLGLLGLGLVGLGLARRRSAANA
jgi:hypothetical protein